MWRLILKDIEQHAKAILLFLLSALFFPAAYNLSLARTEDASAYLGVVFGFIVLGAPGLFAFLFIGQEKLKGTFKLLSILPIARRDLIFAKALASILMCLILVNITAAIYPVIIRAILGYDWVPNIRIILWLNLLVLFFTSANIAIFTLLESKIATQIMYFLYVFSGLSVILASRYVHAASDPETLMQSLNVIGFQYWGWVVIILASYVLVRFSGRLFEMKEWVELEEN